MKSEVDPNKCKNWVKKCHKCIHQWECLRKLLKIADYYEPKESITIGYDKPDVGDEK